MTDNFIFHKTEAGEVIQSLRKILQKFKIKCGVTVLCLTCCAQQQESTVISLEIITNTWTDFEALSPSKFHLG